MLLTAACMWLINSLHARPDDGSSARDLMRAILPVTDEEDHLVLAYSPRGGGVGVPGEGDDDALVELDSGTPHHPFGAIFLKGLAIRGSVPRMRRGDSPFLSASSFYYFFRKTEEEVRHQYHNVGMLPRTQSNNPHRPSNRARCTRTYIPPPGSHEPLLFHLAEKGHRLPTPPIDENSDNEAAPEAYDQGPGSGDIDEQVTRLWKQFLVDAVNKAPNPKRSGTSSYLKLQFSDRQLVDEEFYKITNLSEVWNACQWRVAGREEFERAFNHLFPPVGHQAGARVQNYRQCQYYQSWKVIATKADRPTAEAIRQAIRRKVFSFNWLPDAAQDKMWPTKAMSAGGRFIRHPHGSAGPAPRILFRKPPTW